VATLHFVCGKAGAGKTTLARRIARDAPAALVCEDAWLSRIADPITNLSEYLIASRRLRSVLTPHVVQLLRLGVSVVFDFAGNTARDRQWVRSIYEQAEAEHVLHYIQADDETCLAHVKQRNESRPEGLFFGEVTREQVAEVNRHFAPPAEEERFNVVTYDARFP
jgi:predicted kinase